ncbi:probable transcription factor At1g61730 [Salvia miltiorrhiza]|uniref:probable transcription factor At1g61730 n=1 Tax=Salvia miltiorrhiza TaxID=226208 RepID=UPI0025AD9505|nr:probable transcription factor At1g61730 [Salvia miltiorrhiza]
MPKHREPVKPVESQSDSGEEEDEEASSEDDSQESESETEQTQTATQKKPQPQMAAKSQQLPPQQAPSSSEEDDSGSETESESDGLDSNAGPPASKPMEETQKSSNEARKARSKPNAPEPITPTKPAAEKRPAEGTATTKNTKRLRKTVEGDPSEKKSNLFQRLWSEDDEIVILKGMIDYTSKYKSDPIWDLNAFHDFIKKNLHIDVTRTQLQDKIRRLKKKYENNKSKEKEGKERTFSKPHEQNAYDLSKMIWGNESGKESGGVKVVASPKANGSMASKTASKKVNAAESEDAVVVSGDGEKSRAKRLNFNSVGATIEERMMISGGEYFGLGQGLEGEQDWQKLRVEELELLQKQLELRVEQTKLVLQVMKDRML